MYLFSVDFKELYKMMKNVEGNSWKVISFPDGKEKIAPSDHMKIMPLIAFMLKRIPVLAKTLKEKLEFN